MNRRAFGEEYPVLSGNITGEFGDSPAHDDEAIARKFASDCPPQDRIHYLKSLLEEVRRFTPHLDEHWEALAQAANRRLYTRDVARDWFNRIAAVWQEELARLTGSS